MKAKIKTFFSPLVTGILIGVLSTATASFAAYTLVIKPKITPPIVQITPTIVPQPSPIPTDSSKFGTLHWYSAPRKIKNPDILSDTTTPDYSGYSFADLGTYQVAEFSKGGQLLITFVRPDGPANATPVRLIFDNKKYYLIESLVNEDYVKKELSNIFNKNKAEIISYQIKDLMPDSSLYLNQTNFIKDNNVFFPLSFSTELKNSTIFATSLIGDLLSVDNPVTDYSYLTTRSYYLKLKDFTLVSYHRSSNIGFSDTRVPYFNYQDGSANKISFITPHIGCGSNNIEFIISSSALTDKNLIGQNGGGIEIFQSRSGSSPIVKYLYDTYKIGRDYPSAPPILTIDQFAATSTHIFYQEKNGDWILLVNPEYSMQAECGKPVIYLYPAKDTPVSVKIGADITKSEPLYPVDGWTVLAYSNGQLDYQGHSYPNLFWEGKGWGIYPDLGNYGFVVSQKDLISTLENHLKLLGLNSQESADFMDFWVPKLPTTPFVRLTWLGTADMNRLAPLSVTPRPDTVIRIFLDFAGLDKPVSLIPQTLSSPPRRGFTLIEWGGLLVR